ncbi:MAG: glycerol-3-phosphate 1-O-acyltransferase PlsY [Alphaproteobacteria bacterium]
MSDPNLIIYIWGGIAARLGVPDWKLVALSWQIFAAATALSYLIGSIPFGLVLTRLAGLGDLRRIGSGNIGATNVLRTGSKTLAVLTLLLDGGKGALVVLVAYRFFGPDIRFFAAIAVVLGHLFPVWLLFRGGKGVATTLGVLLGLSWLTGIAALILWLVVATAVRYSSLAALVSVGLAPVYGWFLGSPQVGGLALILAALVILRHIGNIRRLLKGEEPKIKLSTA